MGRGLALGLGGFSEDGIIVGAIGVIYLAYIGKKWIICQENVCHSFLESAY
jgi:hypothetical protein